MVMRRDNFPRDSVLCLDGRVTHVNIYPTIVGESADIFEGDLGDQKVAVKVVPYRTQSQKVLRRLWRDYLAWSKLSHPNVLPYLGYSYLFFSPVKRALPSWISPWMENGPITSYLEWNPEADRIKLLVGIANGLAYLHSLDPVFVHGDIRGRNVLVSEDGVPYIIDYSLSRVLGQTVAPGSLRWAAPELLLYCGHTVHTDVWAYGMTILEIFSGEWPYSDVKTDGAVYQLVDDGVPPIRPDHSEMLDDEIWKICSICWTYYPAARPSMQEVVSMLTSYSSTTPPHTEEQQRHEDDSLSTESLLTVPPLPDGFDPELAPSELKAEGPDWLAVYNGKMRRHFDLDLMIALVHESAVYCVRFSQHGLALATACNNTVHIYRTSDGTKLSSFSDEEGGRITDLRFHPIGFKFLAVCTENGQIKIWDLFHKSPWHTFEGHQPLTKSLDFSGDGRMMIPGYLQGTVELWNMKTGQGKVLRVTEKLDVDASVTSVAISYDGKLVASGSLDDVVRLWDAETGELLESLAGHAGGVHSISFTPDDRGLVVGTYSGALIQWSLTRTPSRGSRRVQLTQPYFGSKAKQKEDSVISLAVSNDSRWVASSAKDCCVQLWDLRVSQTFLFLQGHKDSVVSVDINTTDGPGMLATASVDRYVKIWKFMP